MSEVKTKIITMTVAGRELSFEPNKTAYNALINEITPKNKMAPMVTYLGRIVTPETKPTLTQLLDDVPGVELQVAEAVNAIYAPVVEIEIKN